MPGEGEEGSVRQSNGSGPNLNTFDSHSTFKPIKSGCLNKNKELTWSFGPTREAIEKRRHF